jgi:predicted MPP superfamily phosphohydrolase
MFEEAIYYLSYLVFPLIAFLIYYLYKSKKKWPFVILFLSLIFIWPRFVEPQIILEKEHTLEVGFETKVALIADLHLGLYKDERFLKRLVSKINFADVEMVIISGDILYKAKPEDLEKLLLPLKEMDVPVYAVAGNHDAGFPGQDLRIELKDTLEKWNVYFLENEIIKHDEITIVGLGSNWANNDDVSIIDQLEEKDNVIVIVHNPDTTLKYQNKKADLTLSGHTHGGQIRIPNYYRKVIPTEGNFDKGEYQSDKTTLVVSSGVGEVGLPMRLFNPPQIEIISLK